RRTTVLIPSRAAPDKPTQVLRISFGEMFAAAHAFASASCNDARARVSPTRTTLLGPPLPRPSTRLSSPTRQVVFVPPPSIPTKIVIELLLSQASRRNRYAPGCILTYTRAHCQL